MSNLLLGLIGSGIQASRTPRMHEREAAAHGITCIYQRIDLEALQLSAAALPELITAAERMGFAGLNITHPCKQTVIALLTDLSDDARALGAVNTVVLGEGKRIGHNTDCTGFGRNFREGLTGAAKESVVQLGAGGGGSATAYAALQNGVQHLTIFDIDAARAQSLTRMLQNKFGESRASAGTDLQNSMAQAQGLIHATPTGMAKYPGLPLLANLLRPDMWVAEIVYFPLETALLKTARQLGCKTLDGGGMAVYQAVDAFRLFTGLEPDATRMRAVFESF